MSSTAIERTEEDVEKEEEESDKNKENSIAETEVTSSNLLRMS